MPQAGDTQSVRFWKQPRYVATAALAVAALIVCVVGLLNDASAFWSGYLTAVVFWIGMSLGCVAIALLHLVCGGRWGRAIARDVRAGAGTIGIAVVAVPLLLLGIGYLYPAATTEGAHLLNPHQRLYFTGWTVTLRLVVDAVVWCGLAAWLIQSYRRRHAAGDSAAPSPRKAALGMIAFWLTASAATVDGVMSLTPGWSSSLFSMIQIVGFAVAALAFLIVLRGEIGDGTLGESERQDSHDLGNLLLAFNFVWMYLAFSQFLITWSGDLPHEVEWYADRSGPATGMITIVLIVLHFALPFGLLLSRAIKRDPRRLAAVALLILMMRFVAIGWTIIPAADGAPAWSALLAFAHAVVLGSVWLAVFAAWRGKLPAPGPDRIADSSSPAGTAAVERMA